MNNKESICAFIFVLLIAFIFLWVRYIQADYNFSCMFDSSPRICSLLLKGKK